MEDRKLDIGDYGMYLFSYEKIISFLKEKKIRSKKLLKVFQDNHEVYLNSIQGGAWLPIVPIDSIHYIIKVNDEFDNKWTLVRQEKGFNLEIGLDNSLWIGSFSDILTIEKDSFEKNTDGFKSYETLDGITVYDAYRFNIPKGKYLVDIKGYKRKEELEYPEANHGFLFEFEKVDEFDGYKDPREDDKYSFNVAQM